MKNLTPLEAFQLLAQNSKGGNFTKNVLATENFWQFPSGTKKHLSPRQESVARDILVQNADFLDALNVQVSWDEQEAQTAEKRVEVLPNGNLAIYEPNGSKLGAKYKRIQ